MKHNNKQKENSILWGFLANTKHTPEDSTPKIKTTLLKTDYSRPTSSIYYEIFNSLLHKRPSNINSFKKELELAAKKLHTEHEEINALPEVKLIRQNAITPDKSNKYSEENLLGSSLLSIDNENIQKNYFKI